MKFIYIFKNSVRTTKKIFPHYKDQFVNTVTSRKIIVVYSKNHIEPVSIVCGRNAELLNVKAGGTYSYHCALKV
jgi:hypothetical protein